MFVAHLIDKTILDFNDKCNQICYDDDHIMKFVHANPSRGTRTLAVIPYDKILYVENRENNNDYIEQPDIE